MASTSTENGGQEQIDLTETKDGGVLKRVLRAGDPEAGSPGQGDTVSVHYVGTLADGGDKFDSSRDRGDHFNFTLGKGQVIKAWDLGVASMYKGELAVLTCKPEYAYGVGGSPPKIPPNATLVFEVELFSWEGEDLSPDSDGTIRKSELKEGEKYSSPDKESLVKVSAVGKCDGREFMNLTDCEFFLGEGSEVGLPEGVDKALLKFNKGMRAVLTIAPKWGYDSAEREQYGIPEGAHIQIDLTLNDYHKSKKSWEMETAEKLEAAEKVKTRGTEFLQKGKLRMAQAKYELITDYLQYETSLEGEQKEQRDKLILAGRLNLALVALKQNDTVACVTQCDKALEEQPLSVKALYRRATAKEMQNDYEMAVVDYKKVLELEPENKAAAHQIAVCQKHIADYHRKEKQTYQHIFEKMAKSDAKKTLVDQKDEEDQRKKVFPQAKAPAETRDEQEGEGDTTENGHPTEPEPMETSA